MRPYEAPARGGCQCSAIRYEITQAPQMVYTCHCVDCQRMTSSAFSIGCVLAEGPSVSFEAIRNRSNALPIAGARQSGGSVRDAAHGSALRGPARQCATYVAEPWMTPPGCAPRYTSGRATNSPGSRYRKATRSSRRSRQIWWGSYTRPGEPRPLLSLPEAVERALVSLVYVTAARPRV